jgi:hypothetical protein
MKDKRGIAFFRKKVIKGPNETKKKIRTEDCKKKPIAFSLAFSLV